ncbi:MAG: alkaline phosphatase family protein [Akkermansia sp.]
MKSSTWQTTPMLPITIRLSNSSRNTATTRLWFSLYSVHTDHAGHKYGWMSREYLQSIEEADQQIGIFFRN